MTAILTNPIINPIRINQFDRNLFAGMPSILEQQPDLFRPALSGGWVPPSRSAMLAAAHSSTPRGADRGLAAGLEARDWGRGGGQLNPNTGDHNWNGYALGWTRRALEAATGREIPLLRQGSASEAYQAARQAGELQQSTQPPAGSVVFVPKADGSYTVGIANPDGRSYRTTVPESRHASTIGDRPLPEGMVSWMSPPAKTGQPKQPKQPEQPVGSEDSPERPKPGSDIGRKARHYEGRREGGWGGMCLSWVRNATEWAAGKRDYGIPLLNAESAEDARQKAARAGILRKGNPPPGAIIYFKPGTYGMNEQYGHIAIANPDGKSFHGSSSRFAGQEVGNMDYPPGAKANVYWTMPEWLINPGKAPKHH